MDINWNVLISIFNLSTVVTVLATVSILSSTAISLDRLLALMMGLRYRHVVTLRRVRALIICLDAKLRISCMDTVWGRKNSLHYFKCVLGFDNSLYPDLNHLLHQDLSPTPPSSNSVTRKPTTTRTTTKRRRNSTEYSAIQEDGFQHSMGAVNITYLLSSLLCFNYFIVSWYITCRPRQCFRRSIFFSLLKLISEPDTLLLEDQRREASSEGHN